MCRRSWVFPQLCSPNARDVVHARLREECRKRTLDASHFFLFADLSRAGVAVDHQAVLKQFEYLNHMNPHTFEVEDLDKLIKSVSSGLTLLTPCPGGGAGFSQRSGSPPRCSSQGQDPRVPPHSVSVELCVLWNRVGAS